MPIGRLKRRADFLRAAKGRRWHADSLTVQASAVQDASAVRDDTAREGARIGFTLTKKVGCAVVRNRARRRLKEAVRLSPDLPVEPGRDYVVIGRVAALRLSFERLKRELAQAVRGASQPGGKMSGSKTSADKKSQQARLRTSRPDPMKPDPMKPDPMKPAP